MALLKYREFPNSAPLAAWLLIFAGAVNGVFAEEHAVISESPITDSDRDHWAFRPLRRPELPAVAGGDWPANPIDVFILARLEGKGIAPQPAADKATLLRRLHLDMIGLPPSPEEVAAFVADRSPDAYQRAVDRLLASPSYGEHWAQFWLDLARFAETDGFEHDKERPGVWRYRDWVIDAFNSDLPYDRFVALQLAGDELQPGDEAARTATGFCLAGPDMPDLNLQAERKSDLLNELTGTVGAVFLGLQLGCAQCHDHMYDPLSQLDFFRLRAVFEPAVDLKGHTFAESKQNVPVSHLLIRGDFRRPGPEVGPAVPRIADLWQTKLEPIAQNGHSTGRRAAFARWLTRADHPLTSRVMVNRLWQQHFGRGLSATPSDFGVMGDAPLHGELLDWLAVEFVDAGWSMKHIHRLIVNSATYRQASRMQSDEDSAVWEAAVAHDPNNLYWSRFPRRRLSGETIRDAMLAAAGSLSRVAGGESVRPPLPPEVVQTLLRADHWKASEAEADHARRSVYIFARRNLRYPIFEAFDRPAATATCDRRQTSTTAPQSLFLLNSEFSLEAARRLAGRLLAEAGNEPTAWIERCHELALSRAPSGDELTDCRAFLQAQPARLAAEQRGQSAWALPIPLPNNLEPALGAALVDFCLAIFNASEFLYLE